MLVKMIDFIFFLVVLLTCSHGLKIFEDGFGGEHKTYDHNTADFGPEEKSYNVSGPFVKYTYHLFYLHISLSNKKIPTTHKIDTC